MHTHIALVFKLSNVLMEINRNTSKSNWLPVSNYTLFYYFVKRFLLMHEKYSKGNRQVLIILLSSVKDLALLQIHTPGYFSV